MTLAPNFDEAFQKVVGVVNYSMAADFAPQVCVVTKRHDACLVVDVAQEVRIGNPRHRSIGVCVPP